MTTSDFPRAAARISEGFCALCDSGLGDGAYCITCDVAWTLQGSVSHSPDDIQVFGTAGVLIIPSRKLNRDEIKRLYARPVEPPSL